MKKSIFGKVGAAAVVLTLVTASLVGGTFAKYVTTVNANATVTAAKWNIAFEKGNTAVQNDTTIDLVADSTNGKATGKIIPGDTGSFAIDINGAGSEVGFKYKITVSDPTGDLTGINFYKDDTYSADALLTYPAVYEDIVEYSETSDMMKDTVTLYWKLADNADDTVLAGKSITYKVSMEAEQSTETPTPAPGV